MRREDVHAKRNDRRWPPRYGKGIDKERERERGIVKESGKESEIVSAKRTKAIEQGVQNRSKEILDTKIIIILTSLELMSRKRIHMRGRSLATSSKSLESRGENRQQIEHDDKNLDLRRPYNINDENSEPPPPGFEVQSSRNPFHTNNNSSFPPSIRERDRSLRNNTPDLYEKCVSQDMEDNNGRCEKEIVSNDLLTNEENGLATDQAGKTVQSQASIAENEEKTPTSSDIKCFDAILDIHEYETDFDDNSFKLQDVANKLVPETSKWELEDQACTTAQVGSDKLDNNQTHNPADNIKVTSDVIVRAEKAIFARAINAIRPIETRTKSVSKERSIKCFSDDHESIRNIQITLPVNINKDRSIEVKAENSEKRKSIKERLGSKVSQPIYSQLADNTRRDSDHAYKSSYSASERNLESERNRDRRRKYSTDNSKEIGKKTESDKNYRHERHGTDKSHEKERDQNRAREREHLRHREKTLLRRNDLAKMIKS
ncbi:hypothetical protein EVAR_103774_1 [Eumeta japonica]|uniref:Uncharacterized protein n=1 Tax=Eumeta variegata TaxID=151549 RepID=A0A4C2A875_EUMVA|nr:hypothetical protein EVAR_103774_1 [Eumeta japonica]